MSSTPATQWSASAAWPLGVLVVGFICIATLMWVSWVVGPDWVRARGVTDWLLEAAYFLPPYALCAVGLWLGRNEHRRRWMFRGVGLLMVVSVIPPLCVALGMVYEFRQTGTPYGILTHMFVAFLALPFQYVFAIISLAVGWTAHRRPIEPNDTAW